MSAISGLLLVLVHVAGQGTQADPAAGGARRLLATYLEAYGFPSHSRLSSLFAPGARIRTQDGIAATRLSVAELYRRHAAGSPSDEHRRVRRLESVVTSGRIASARVAMDYPHQHHTVFLTLVRTAGRWLIDEHVDVVEQRDAAEVARRRILDSDKPVTPFRIVGNVYYVGSSMISAFLIVTDSGHFLLDGGTPEMASRIASNVEALGFRMTDVRVMLNSHAHIDHVGGFPQLGRRSRALLYASAEDAALMRRGGRDDFQWGDAFAYQPLKPDRIISDNDTVRLSNAAMIAMITPGHTKGCTSWKTTVIEAAHPLEVVFVCAVSVAGARVVQNPKYRGLLTDLTRSLERLARTPADVMLASHPFFFNMSQKLSARASTSRNPFIDPTELARHAAMMEKQLATMIAEQRP